MTLVVTGEEEETVLYTGRCKLFVWMDENWKERGIGSLKINVKEDGSHRLGKSVYSRL